MHSPTDSARLCRSQSRCGGPPCPPTETACDKVTDKARDKVEPLADSSRQTSRGLVLFSGGLDSLLAVCVLREQGCHVEGVVFDSPFFNIRAAHTGARALDLPLRTIDFTADITELIMNPRRGFGTAMNPCIDCHARMIRRAGERMQALGWDFIATGEVVNQRPMSQNRQALSLVARDSGFADYLIRPLSAQLLEPTRPELDGRVDRSRLLKLSGRSRLEQAALARKYGLRDYPSSGGGCLLTERQFCNKLQDLKDHEGLGEPRDLLRLRLGRHFRLPGGAKCIVGRNAGDNQRLAQQLQVGERLIRPLGTPGPTAILSAGATAPDVALALGLVAGYCDAGTETVRLACTDAGGQREVTVARLPRETARQWIL